MSPGARLSTNASTSRADGPGRERHVGAGQLGQPVGGGPQRQLGLAVLGPAQVRHQHDPGAPAAQLLDRRDRRADAGVVGDRAIVQRHIEVDPDKHPLAIEIAEVGQGPHEQLLDELHDPVGVAPLVVVPGDDLDHRPVHDRGQLRVDDRRGGVLDDVGGDDRVLGVGQQALQRAAVGGGLQRGVDLLDGGLAVGLDRQVDDAAGGTGARTANPWSLPLSSGITSPIALAAPVEAGIRLIAAARARRRSRWGMSCSRWSAV